MVSKGNFEDAYLKTDGKGVHRLLSVEVLVVAAVILATSAGFSFGYLFGKEQSEAAQTGVWIEEAPTTLLKTSDVTYDSGVVAGASVQKTTASDKVFAPATSGSFVASKNGTSYHLPHCSGAKNIKEENKIWFATKTEAETAGYRPAKNCKGM